MCSRDTLFFYIYFASVLAFGLHLLFGKAVKSNEKGGINPFN